jgi:lysophospholipase L1-like esterase
MISPNDIVLFQGDSITDCGRNREVADPNNSGALGLGYAHLIAAELLAQKPALSIYNRGVSGNRVVDLYARVKSDLINLKPNLVSILIGVNDTWHEFRSQNGVSVPKYERVYRDLLTETREALPEVRLVICEPFVLLCGVVTEDWVKEIDARRAVAAKLAKEFNAIFVPFQSAFDEALRIAGPLHWTCEGVHPTPAGHHIMARTWLKHVAGC